MPKGFTFEVGEQYLTEGTPYQIIELLSKGQLVVRNLLTAQLTTAQVNELRQEWKMGNLRFGLDGPNLRENKELPIKTSYEFTDLSFLPEELREETWGRYSLIKPLLQEESRTRQVVENRVKEFLAEKERFSFSRQTLSPETVYRWIRRFEEGHQNIRALVPGYSRRGKKGTQLVPLVEDLLMRAIEEVYYTDQRSPKQHVVDKLRFFINQANQALGDAPEAGEKLRMPSRATVYRYLDRLDPEETDIARLGRERANRKHRQVQAGPKPTRVNQCWEIDHTTLDLLVVDDIDGLPVGRPTLTVARDKCSGYLTGLALSFEPPSYRAAMECLFYAIIEKEHVKSLLQTSHEYLGYGLPERLVFDNARELVGRDLEEACLELGIEFDPNEKGKPWLKGSVERWIKSINTDLIHTVPGTTFSNFLVRGDYDPKQHSCITLDGLWRMLHLWIVDIYTQKWHRGVGGVPARIWQRALEQNFVPRLPASREELLVLLSRIQTRKLWHYGIEFENIIYQSDGLGSLRSQGRTETKKRHPTVTFKYNPGDLSRIWVLDKISRCYIEVPANDQQYTQGLSFWKHQVIKRYIREEMKRQVNEDNLVAAREAIQRLVLQAFQRGKRLSTRAGAARWLDYQVSDWLRGNLPNDRTATPANLSAIIPGAVSRGLPEFELIKMKSVLANDELGSYLPVPITQLAPTLLPQASTQPAGSIAHLKAELPELVAGVSLGESPTTPENASTIVEEGLDHNSKTSPHVNQSGRKQSPPQKLDQKGTGTNGSSTTQQSGEMPFDDPAQQLSRQTEQSYPEIRGSYNRPRKG
jgi:putative transposase